MTVRAIIVDDNAEFLGVARGVLERAGILVTDVAATCAEALRAAQEHQPDVALVDIELRDESGFEVAEHLSRTSRGRTRVILISTHSGEDFQELIAASPAIGFVAKSRLSATAVLELLDGQDTADMS
jgi:CheY-like chemotaxis protein